VYKWKTRNWLTALTNLTNVQNVAAGKRHGNIVTQTTRQTVLPARHCFSMAADTAGLQLSTVLDDDLRWGSTALRSNALHFLQHVHSANHLTKDHMLPIQPTTTHTHTHTQTSKNCGDRKQHPLYTVWLSRPTPKVEITENNNNNNKQNDAYRNCHLWKLEKPLQQFTWVPCMNMELCQVASNSTNNQGLVVGRVGSH